MKLDNFFLIIKKNYLQIKTGGIIVLLKKIISLFFLIPTIPIYFLFTPLVIIIRIISPWYLIRWHQIYSNRIGHFSKEIEILYCEQKLGINVPSQRHLNLFFFHRHISNRQLAKMWKRNLNILPRWLLVPLSRVNSFINIILTDKNRHSIKKPYKGLTRDLSRDVYNVLKKFDPGINFNNEEEEKGRILLLQLGLNSNDKFVCLAVRDSKFFSVRSSVGRDYSYHDFRNGELEKFILAAEKLTKMGYFVVRMGVDVLQPLKSNNSMIIDYANSSIRSEFMDVYLASKCSFGVSTDFGIDEVMVCFRKPIVYIGVVPVGGVTTSNKNSLVIFKEHIDINTNKKLSISEIFDRKLSSAYNKKLFSENNVRLIHNTPEQIKDAVIEMDKRLKGIWKETEEEKILQNNFWSNFRKNCKKDDFQNHEKRHGIVHGEFASKVSLKFLKENKHLLD